jgi:hypothetical protein
MNKPIAILFVLITALAAPAIVTSQEAGRGTLFQIGAGAGFPFYPEGIEAAFSNLDSMPGVDRTKVSLDLALGFAFSQQGYFMARIDGLGDRLSINDEYMQMNLYLYSLGLRYYPEVTGFYIEGDAGASAGVVMISTGVTSVSSFGFGYGAGIGYDFTTKARGFGLCLEAKYDGLTIDSEQAGVLMLTLALCWK